MRRMIRRQSTRRRVQWLGGAVWSTSLFAYDVPSVEGSSTVIAAWVRVPAGAFDTVNDREVEVDWTLIREINTGMISVRNDASGNLGYIAAMGVLAWDGISDSPPSALDVPFPVQNPGYDWIWWWQFHEHTILPAGGQSASTPGTDGLIFTKSQRKLSAGTGLLLVVEVFATISGNAAHWGVSQGSRYTYKLP